MLAQEGPGCQPGTLSQHPVPAPAGAAARASGGQPLVEPAPLAAVGHGPQGVVSCREAPPKDNPVVQAVGLALPEFYHLWVQDVAAPTKSSRGLGALCIFLSHVTAPTPATPGPPEGSCWDVSDEG